MKKLFSLLIITLFYGCLTAEIERDQGDIKTISFHTGACPEESGIYDKKFILGAEKVCKGDEFEVLEKSRHPSTIDGNNIQTSRFYWVIRCVKKSKT